MFDFKKMMYRVAEVLVALCLVFLLAALWGRYQERSRAKETVEVPSRGAQAVPDSSLGNKSLAIEDKGAQDGRVQTKQSAILDKYFHGEGLGQLEPRLTIDLGENAFKSGKSLAEFMQLLRQTPIKPSYISSRGDVGFSFITDSQVVPNVLAYPRPYNFIELVKRFNPGFALSHGDGARIGASKAAPIPEKVDRVYAPFANAVTVASVSHGQPMETAAVDGLELICEGERCGLSLVGASFSTKSGLRAIIFGDIRSFKPKLVVEPQENSSRFTWGLLDVDGDTQYDASIFLTSKNKRFEPEIAYMAANDEGVWRLKYIHEGTRIQGDSVRMAPEPGEYNEPLAVRIYSDGNQGLTYTLDGLEPDCERAIKAGKLIQEAELLISKTTSVSAKLCGPLHQSSDLLTAKYIIPPK